MLDFMCMRPVGLTRTADTSENSETKNRRLRWVSNPQPDPLSKKIPLSHCAWYEKEIKNLYLYDICNNIMHKHKYMLNTRYNLKIR